MTAAVLGKPVDFLSFRCLAVPSLGLPAAFLSALDAAFLTAVGMAPEAAAADVKSNLAEVAATFDEKHSTFRELANSRRSWYN